MLLACSNAPTPQPTFQPKVVFYAGTRTAAPKPTATVDIPTAMPATEIPATNTAEPLPPTDTPQPTDTLEPTATSTATPQPTSTHLPTSTPTVTSTPCPTETPQPKATSTITFTATLKGTLTKTPTRRPTLTLTPTPTCLQARAAANRLKITRVVPTVAPTQEPVHVAPGILYGMSRVTSPLMGERMHGTTPPLITWDAEPLQHPNDYYALYIQHLKGWDVACYKAKQGYAPEWLPGLEPHHGFGVYVVILRSPTQVAEGAYCTGDPVSPSTEPWTVFFWSFQ